MLMPEWRTFEIVDVVFSASATGVSAGDTTRIGATILGSHGAVGLTVGYPMKISEPDGSTGVITGVLTGSDSGTLKVGILKTK